jgi:uncharacterized protein with FMN-binding domain
MSTKQRSNKQMLAGIALLILTVFIVGGAIATSKSSHPAMKEVASTTTTSKMSGDSGSMAAHTGTMSGTSYKDGTYSATGSYDSPGGLEKISVTLTLASDKVTAATAVSGANDPTASSLTPMGFNKAVAAIEKQAEA